MYVLANTSSDLGISPLFSGFVLYESSSETLQYLTNFTHMLEENPKIGLFPCLFFHLVYDSPMLIYYQL